jgi:hypothetical protein
METFFVSEKEKSVINALQNVSEEAIETKINTLKKWIGQCPHLPLESKDEEFLKIMLLRGKFQEGNVKKRVQNYFTHLCKYPEFFVGFKNIKPSNEVGVVVTSPALTPSWERIVILSLDSEKLEKVLDVHRCLYFAIATGTILFNYDYVPSVRVILDFESWTMSHILQGNINDFFKVRDIYENVFKMRISGIEIINAPHLLGAVLNLAKVVLKPKLFSRITVHKDLRSLYEKVPKQNLPSDYGGELQSVKELLKVWDEIFTKKRGFLDNIEQLCQRNDQEQSIFGAQGSFKTLVVD